MTEPKDMRHLFDEVDRLLKDGHIAEDIRKVLPLTNSELRKILFILKSIDATAAEHEETVEILDEKLEKEFAEARWKRELKQRQKLEKDFAEAKESVGEGENESVIVDLAEVSNPMAVEGAGYYKGEGKNESLETSEEDENEDSSEHRQSDEATQSGRFDC